MTVQLVVCVKQKCLFFRRLSRTLRPRLLLGFPFGLRRLEVARLRLLAARLVRDVARRLRPPPIILLRKF